MSSDPFLRRPSSTEIRRTIYLTIGNLLYWGAIVIGLGLFVGTGGPLLWFFGVGFGGGRFLTRYLALTGLLIGVFFIGKRFKQTALSLRMSEKGE